MALLAAAARCSDERQLIQAQVSYSELTSIAATNPLAPHNSSPAASTIPGAVHTHTPQLHQISAEPPGVRSSLHPSYPSSAWHDVPQPQGLAHKGLWADSVGPVQRPPAERQQQLLAAPSTTAAVSGPQHRSVQPAMHQQHDLATDASGWQEPGPSAASFAGAQPGAGPYGIAPVGAASPGDPQVGVTPCSTDQ